MVRTQGCKKCKQQFSEDSDQRNYNLYQKYGFKSKKNFQKHSSRNKRCPFKVENNTQTNLAPIWEDYVKPKDYYDDERDLNDDREETIRRLKKHERGGRKLWYNTTDQAVLDIVDGGIRNKKVQWISLVAQPGSGKTMVSHYLIYYLTSLWCHINDFIHPNNITITTGMSDKDWLQQTKSNFTLRDGKFLWESISKLKENNCIVHRTNFNKRITWLLENRKFISNHVFIIDESHFADRTEMTIDDELKRLGLTEERMIEYNIKVILISATPDVTLSIMTRKDNHKVVELKNGTEYKGFEYFSELGYIIDYSDEFNVERFVRATYSTPRYHYIRAKTIQDKGEYRVNIKNMCERNNWECYEDDSSNNYYISAKKDIINESKKQKNYKIIRTYERPTKHTFILIKEKYRASKRLKLTPYIGLIAEKPAKQMNTTVTCNGLIPRFFGYDPLYEYENNQHPIFICNKKCVEEYITFTKTWKYKRNDGTFEDYSGRLIKSQKKKLTEKKNTTYGKMGGETPIKVKRQNSTTCLTQWLDPNTISSKPTVTLLDGNTKQFQFMLYKINGLWCHSDRKERIEGNYTSLPGSGGDAGKQNVLEYNKQKTLCRVVQVQFS